MTWHQDWPLGYHNERHEEWSVNVLHIKDTLYPLKGVTQQQRIHHQEKKVRYFPLVQFIKTDFIWFLFGLLSDWMTIFWSCFQTEALIGMLSSDNASPNLDHALLYTDKSYSLTKTQKYPLLPMLLCLITKDFDIQPIMPFSPSICIQTHLQLHRGTLLVL